MKGALYFTAGQTKAVFRKQSMDRLSQSLLCILPMFFSDCKHPADSAVSEHTQIQSSGQPLLVAPGKQLGLGIMHKGTSTVVVAMGQGCSTISIVHIFILVRDQTVSHH